MTWRAFRSQLALVVVACSAGIFAEGLAVAVRAGSVARGMTELAWTFGLWGAPSALLAAAFAVPLAAACGDSSPTLVFVERFATAPFRAAAWLALAALSWLAALVFLGARVSRTFHNVELSAALLALAVPAWVALLGCGAWLLWCKLAHRQSSRGLAAFAVCSAGGVLAWVLFESRIGLAQLDPRLAGAPGAALLVFFGWDAWPRLRRHAPRVAAALGVGWLACWAAFLSSGERAAAVLSLRGAWSRPLIVALQRVTDFDGDGYSSFLGGGDCAPLDSSIGPGAQDLVADGIDNNCIGGDAGTGYAPHRPSWGSSVHGSIPNLNLVIVTIETLRQDHASFVGARHDTTPVLRGLAASSLVFTRMYSAAPYTRLALGSLFSSYAPSEIEWLAQAPNKHARRLAEATPWLPEMLRDAGYETIAVLSDFSAFTALESIGFERGFQHYDTTTRLEYRGGTMGGFPASEQVDKALGYLARAQRPFLLWLHLFEPHYRYEQPPGAPIFGNDEQSRYDAEIWAADHELGRLFQGLRELGVWDSTILFVSGDHGEAFGEHDDRWHGSNLHDPQLRPAALLRVPGVAAKRVDIGVTFTDVAPTLARLLDKRQIFERLQGRSLAPLMHHEALADAEGSFIAETFRVEDGKEHQAALIAHPLKLIYVQRDQRFSLYDLAADPAERRPLDPRSDPRGAPLLRELITYLEHTGRSVRSAP